MRKLPSQLLEGASDAAAAAAVSSATSSLTSVVSSAGLSGTAGCAEVSAMKSDMMSRKRPQKRSGMVTAVR